MDQKINQYLDNLVADVLASPGFANIPAEQKDSLKEKVRNYLNGIIIDTSVDNFTVEQVKSLENIDAGSQEMQDKIEEYSSQIPFLAEQLEDALNKAVIDLKQNPQNLN